MNDSADERDDGAIQSTGRPSDSPSARRRRVRAARGAIVIGAAALLAGAAGWVYTTVGGAVSWGGTTGF